MKYSLLSQLDFLIDTLYLNYGRFLFLHGSTVYSLRCSVEKHAKIKKPPPPPPPPRPIILLGEVDPPTKFAKMGEGLNRISIFRGRFLGVTFFREGFQFLPKE